MKTKKHIFKAFRFLLILIFLLWILLPVAWMIGMSLKSFAEQYAKDIRLFPESPTWENYSKIWTTVPLGKYFFNSIVISIVTVIVCLIISAFAAYALSKFKFRGREAFGISALFTQLMPGILFLLPIYIIFVKIQQSTGIQIVGTHFSVILTYATFGIPFSIWMLRSYFDTIPMELSEAGLIDGCSRTTTFLRIVLPLAMPGIAATAMYVFTLSWNEILFATVLTDSSSRTFAVGLREFESQHNTDFGQLMAASVVVTAPVVILFLSFQRLIVSGLTGGAVKE